MNRPYDVRALYTLPQSKAQGAKPRPFLSCTSPVVFRPMRHALCSMPYHLITRSARAKTFGAMLKPICLAAFKLMINSNLGLRSFAYRIESGRLEFHKVDSRVLSATINCASQLHC
jgi:hypothetical protein